MSTDLATLSRLDLDAAVIHTAAGEDEDFDITHELDLGPGWRALAWLGVCMGYATYVVDLPMQLVRLPRRASTRGGRS